MAAGLLQFAIGARRLLSHRCYSSIFGQVRLCHQNNAQPKKVMFLGTPLFVTPVLQALITAAAQPNSGFEVCAVVSRAGSTKRNKRKPFPVEALALKAGLAQEAILTPESTDEDAFLCQVERLAPDLCVVAAYGCLLPQRFLDIPPLGTINVHPSLLPKFRGAAPIVRAVEAGVTETGVSLAFTVLKCDTGPVLEQCKVPVDSKVNASDLTWRLFRLGTDMLIRRLPDLLSGRALALATPQDHASATVTRKISSTEREMDLSLPAAEVHNKIRAHAWPRHSLCAYITLDAAVGHSMKAEQTSPDSSRPSPAERQVQVLVREARVVGAAEQEALGLQMQPPAINFHKERVFVPCGGGSVLELLQVTVANKTMPVSMLRGALELPQGAELLVADVGPVNNQAGCWPAVAAAASPGAEAPATPSHPAALGAAADLTPAHMREGHAAAPLASATHSSPPAAAADRPATTSSATAATASQSTLAPADQL